MPPGEYRAVTRSLLRPVASRTPCASCRNRRSLGLQALPGSKGALKTRKEREKEPQARYRDGKVVSQKGEKYIVEKVGEEWDGGSRGKVYTKGKRGVGFR